jgi:NitT/TauT family transport system substrate-binding protein
MEEKRLMRITLNRLGLALLAVAALLLSPSAQAQEKPWRHAIVAAKSDAGIVLMVTKGFAEKQGLKLEITQVDSDAIALKALLAGELDSFDGSPTGSMIAASRGADVKILGCGWPGLPHGVFVHNAVAKLQDLKGKTIAISQPGAMPDQLVRTLLGENGMTPDDVKLANLGGDNDRYKALVAGVVDAAVVSGEYTPIAAKADIKMLIPAREVFPNYLRMCTMTNSATLKNRHDDLVRYLAADMAALRYALSHRDESLALTRQITGIAADDPRPAYIYDDALRNHAVDPDIGLPREKLDWMQQQSVKVGDQPRLNDLAKITDEAPRKEALQRVGN